MTDANELQATICCDASNDDVWVSRLNRMKWMKEYDVIKDTDVGESTYSLCLNAIKVLRTLLPSVDSSLCSSLTRITQLKLLIEGNDFPFFVVIPQVLF